MLWDDKTNFGTPAEVSLIAVAPSQHPVGGPTPTGSCVRKKLIEKATRRRLVRLIGEYTAVDSPPAVNMEGIPLMVVREEDWHRQL